MKLLFTANNLNPTDFSRLTNWLHTIQHWQQQGLQQLFFFLHTPQKHLTTEIAQFFIQQLQAISNIALPTITNKN